MEAFLVSTGIVALAEIGDKTQLLSFVLAARFRRPVPILLGILFATLANHAAAGAAGAWVAQLLGPQTLRWVIALSFFGIAAWMFVPDKLGENAAGPARFGVFATTLVAFFLVEIGDKTQIATIALAARYPSLAAVVAGTTLGMLIANAPAVLLGERIAHRMPLRAIHLAAAVVFVALGAATLLGAGEGLGF